MDITSKSEHGTPSPSEMREFVEKQLHQITQKRKGIIKEASVEKKQIEFSAFFRSGDCCTSTSNT